MKATIYAIIIASFVFGIVFTVSSVAYDTDHSKLETPRVNLLRSYWYEGYAPNKLMKTVNVPIFAYVCDRYAIPIYAAHNGVTLTVPGKSDTTYVLTAYSWGGINRINKDEGFHNIYMITRGK